MRAVVTIVACAFTAVASYHMGKEIADHWYSKHPVMEIYQEQGIVLTHGERACPEDHTCTWKAIDLNTGKEVQP